MAGGGGVAGAGGHGRPDEDGGDGQHRVRGLGGQADLVTWAIVHSQEVFCILQETT